MARMTVRGFMDVFESRTYARFNVSNQYIFDEIVRELRMNNITCHASLERSSFCFKKMETDGTVLFLSEIGLFSIFVTVCAVGNFSQVQIITRNVARKYSFSNANNSLEHSMHNLYKDAVILCIRNVIERIATTNNWSCLSQESTEVEAE